MIDILQTFCRLFTIIVFSVSFLGKVRDIRAFGNIIDRFQMLPKQMSLLAAYIFLFLEAIIVAMLLVKKLNIFGFSIAVVLLIIFTIGLWNVLKSDIETSCNCFGISERKISIYDILRNVIVIIIGIMGILTTINSTSNDYLVSISSVIMLPPSIITFIIVTNLQELQSLFK